MENTPLKMETKSNKKGKQKQLQQTKKLLPIGFRYSIYKRIECKNTTTRIQLNNLWDTSDSNEFYRWFSHRDK